jgi:hypothetical protein
MRLMKISVPPLPFALGLSALALVGCPNDHVFLPIPQCATTVIEEAKPQEISKAADILIVVDNSGSMCEEQENLVANFYDANCPITDLGNIPEQFKNPDPATVAILAENCGFIQILAAYENDFRVGVITTDVALCDNRFGIADNPDFEHPNRCDGVVQPGWGRRPMRGCLQRPVGATKKFISRGDDDDIGIRFRDTLAAVQTFGSAFERGLDAMKIFLSPNETKHPDCEDDLASFIRDDASLVVIYLTDEDDCSHNVTPAFTDENAGDSCDVPFLLPTEDSSKCYTERDALTPVQGYVDFLKNYKGPLRTTDVRVAVIAGGLPEGDQLTSASCIIDNGAPLGTCTPSFGTSNFVEGSSTCNPANLAAQGLPACCVADAGDRYLQFAEGFGAQALSNSICYDNFRATMVAIAQFAAATDKVDLDKTPANQVAIIVKIRRQGSTEPELIGRIPNGADPSGKDGWQLEGSRTIRFYGNAKPQPGDEVFVSALGESATQSEECTGDFGGDAGG